MATRIIILVLLLHSYSLCVAQPVQRAQIDQQITLGFQLLDSAHYNEVIEKSSQTLDLSSRANYKEGLAKSRLLLGIALYKTRKREEAIDHMERALLDSAFFNPGNLNNLKANLASYYAYKSAYDVSEKYYRQTLGYYKGKKDHARVISLLTSLGGLFTNKGSYLEAGDLFEEAYSMALDKQIYNDMAWIFQGLSTIYRKYRNSTESKKLGYEAVSLYESIPELAKFKGRGYYNLGQTFYKENEYDSAVILFKLALDNSDNPIFNLASLANVANGYLSLKKIDSAEKYIEKGLSIFRKNYPHKEYSFYPYKARVHLERNELDSAEYFANNYLDLAKGENHGEVYELLFEVNKKRNNYGRALFYHERYTAHLDSLNQKSKDEEFTSFRVRMETMKKEKEIDQLKSEAEINRLTIILILISIFSVLVILGILFRLYQLSARRKRLKIELERNKIKLELDHNKRELSDFTLSMIRKNKLLEELHQLAKNAGTIDSREWRRMIRVIEQNKTSEKDWEHFNQYFGTVHNDFFDKLKARYPKLSKSELRQAALIKMNMSLKESSDVLGIDPNSVKVARFRMKKKLGIGAEENLSAAIGGI